MHFPKVLCFYNRWKHGFMLVIRNVYKDLMYLIFNDCEPTVSSFYWTILKKAKLGKELDRL